MNKDDIIISLLKEIDENIDNVNDSEGPNANLEELTITSNGTYTPQEGVDGFSKVNAEFDPSSLPKVKPSLIRVTNACIDENGYWAGELLDTSEMTSMNQLFEGCSKLKKLDTSNWRTSKATQFLRTFTNCSSLETLDVSNWDTSNSVDLDTTFSGCSSLKTLDVSNWDVRKMRLLYGAFSGCSSLETLDVSKWNTISFYRMDKMFNGCSSLKQLDVSNWDTSSVINMYGIFYRCSSLETLDVSKWDTSSVTNMDDIFRGCKKLQNIDMTNWDCSKVTSMPNTFAECILLQSIVGNRTIDEVIANNIGALNGLKVATVLNATILERASLRAVINGLADLTGQTAQTLTLGATLIAKLTEEDIAIATAKNWTLS